MKKIYYVYRLINPIDNIVFYIGSGCEDRVSQHWVNFLKCGMKSCSNNYDKYCALKSIKEAGLVPIEEVLTKRNMDFIAAENLETKYILQIGRICNNTGPLVNIKIHQRCPSRTKEIAEKIGISNKKRRQENPDNYKREPMAEATKLKISKKQKEFYKTDKGKVAIKNFVDNVLSKMKGENHPQYGTHITDEHKLILSIAHTGKEIDFDHRQKISQGIKDFYKEGNKPGPNTGNKFSEEWKEQRSKDYTGENNPNYGKGKKFWINNGFREKMMDFRMDFPERWSVGKITKVRKDLINNEIMDLTSFDLKENFYTLYKKQLEVQCGFKF